MSQLNFLRAADAVPLAAVAACCGVALPPDADGARPIRAIAPLDRATVDDIAAFNDGILADMLEGTRAGACLVQPAHLALVPRRTVALVTDTPWADLMRIANMLAPAALRPSTAVRGRGIDPSVRIYEGTLLERGVSIDPGAVLGPGVEVGSGTFIGAQVVIGSGVRIGRDCAIDSHVSLAHALIGDRVVIRAGARVGLGSAGLNLGRVIIQNGVEIGANAAIDRGIHGDTVLGEGTVVSALAHVPGGSVTPRLTRFTGLSPRA